MKMMMVIIRDTDDENVIREMVKQGYRVTRMASTGGFLRRGNITLMVGVEDDQVEEVRNLLQRVCKPSDSEQHHRATLFVVNMAYFEKI